VDSSSYFTLVGNESTKARIGFANWAQDFPEGSNFIDVLLNGTRITPEHSNNLAWYTGADKQIASTNALLDQNARNKSWGEIDEQIVKDAAWAPFMHGITYTFVSERVQNYTHSPVYDMLFMKAKLKGAKPLADGSSADPAKAIGGGRSPELPDSKTASRERLIQRRVGS
jgi:peptide/nickel transport system substrate-binding protein